MNDPEPEYYIPPSGMAQRNIQARAELRDLPNGERSMARTVRMFNAYSDVCLTEAEGWMFMQCLKMARHAAGAYHKDDLDDLSGFTDLLAEHLRE